MRDLIDNNRIPDDVTIQVLTQAREELIERIVPDLTLRGIALAYTAAVEADA